MQERGRMQEGMVADITIFDPENVTDNSTYTKGTVPTTGIPYVLVNGTVVVKDSKVLPDVFPGRPIRFDPTDSKYEAVDPEIWKTQYLATPIDHVHHLDDCIHGF
jgi:N-acyl-D-aspartate/D-glutamate deacylase